MKFSKVSYPYRYLIVCDNSQLYVTDGNFIIGLNVTHNFKNNESALVNISSSKDLKTVIDDMQALEVDNDQLTIVYRNKSINRISVSIGKNCGLMNMTKSEFKNGLNCRADIYAIAKIAKILKFKELLTKHISTNSEGLVKISNDKVTFFYMCNK